jgi:hypothetical protein
MRKRRFRKGPSFLFARGHELEAVDALTACDAADYARREIRSIVWLARLSAFLPSSWLDFNGGFARGRRFCLALPWRRGRGD